MSIRTPVCIALSAVSLLASGSVMAAEAPIKVTKDYHLDADVSYLMNTSTGTDGSSTDKQNLAANISYKRMLGVWGQEVKAEAVSTQDDNATDNIERYLLSGKLMHQQGEHAYQFAKLQLEKDLNSAFDYQASLTGGVGYEFLKDDIQLLTGEVGAGVRYSKDRAPPQDTRTEALGTLAVHYQRKLTDTTHFTQDLGYEYGAESSTFRSKTSLAMAISKQISGLVSYQIKDISADEGNSRDALTSIGLKYSH